MPIKIFGDLVTENLTIDLCVYGDEPSNDSHYSSMVTNKGAYEFGQNSDSLAGDGSLLPSIQYYVEPNITIAASKALEGSSITTGIFNTECDTGSCDVTIYRTMTAMPLINNN